MGRCSDPACPHLLQLPEDAYEARAKAEDNEQQQEGLVDGGDVYHDVDQATCMPFVPAVARAARSLTLHEALLAPARIADSGKSIGAGVCRAFNAW